MSTLKKLIESLENENVLLDINVSIFLKLFTSYLFGTLIFLLMSIFVIPLCIRAIPMSISRWYNKKNTVKIEAKRLLTLKQDVRKALDNHAIKCLKEHPQGLKLEGLDKENSMLRSWNSLDKFLYDFFHTFNLHRDTINPIDNIVTCSTHRRRSLGDIYLICKYYYPNCTIQDVMSIIIRMLEHGNIRASYCNTINKYVFHNDTNGGYIRFSKVEYKGINNFEDIIYTYKNVE